MTDTINIQNRSGSTTTPNNAKANATANNGQSASSSASNADKTKPAAIIELSNAVVLESIGEQIDKLPEVNEARVASIKESLAQGEYQPDANVIARKFQEIEKLREAFGLQPEDLNIDLGPLGKLL